MNGNSGPGPTHSQTRVAVHSLHNLHALEREVREFREILKGLSDPG